MRFGPRYFAALHALAFVSLLSIGCAPQMVNDQNSAYVAPASLNLRRELTQKNATVAVLHHKERVQVIETRRRFVKVRTAAGAEGWVDALQLLTPEQMDRINQDTEAQLRLPSEGSAGVFEPLNVHIDPIRTSPAFTKVPEGASVDVLAHRLTPKGTSPTKPPVFTIERPQAPSRRKRKEVKAIFPFPKPELPKPPESLLDTDGRQADEDAKDKEPDAPAKPVVMEDWTLVRTKDKQVGWVLSRNLTMSIPDEVAQYAEGKHITSYFDLGAINDEEKGLKHNWLWTTASHSDSNDFDGWRVFIWNRRRHRYETSYREHDVDGYYPIHVDAADPGTVGRTFQLITKDDDGRFWRSAYSFDGVRVHLAGRQPYSNGHPLAPDGTAQPSTGMLAKDTNAKPSWVRRQWDEWKQRLGKRTNTEPKPLR